MNGKLITRRSVITAGVALAASPILSCSQGKEGEFKAFSSELSRDPSKVDLLQFDKLTAKSRDAQREKLLALGLTPSTIDEINATWEMVLDKLGAYVKVHDL